ERRVAQSAVDGLRVSDIGGHPLRDGGWFRSGLVFRISGGMIGPAEIAHLDSLHLRVLIDLRGGEEDRSRLVDWAAGRGVRYHHEPIVLAKPVDLAAALDAHGRTEADGRAFLAGIYRRMLDEFSAPLLELLGVDRATVLAGYVNQAPDRDRLLEAVATWWDWEEGDLAKPGLGGILSAVEEVMAGALDYLDERYGGAVRYVEAAGLPLATLEQLRARLVADEPG